MVSVVARWMVSLGSRMSPEFSNKNTSVMRFNRSEEGEEVGKGAWVRQGGGVGFGQLGAGHHEPVGGRGPRRKP